MLEYWHGRGLCARPTVQADRWAGTAARWKDGGVTSETTQAAQAAGGRAAARRTPRDMALSMAVLLVPVLLLVGAYKVFFNGDHPREVNPAAAFVDARHAARFPVHEPGGLPAGWSAISYGYATEQGFGTLRVGYVTPGGDGVQLVESDRPVDALLPAELGEDARAGSLVDIGGRQWREYPMARDGNQALVLAEDRGTTVLVGAAPMADLHTFAAALH
jgi:hypothetical protein